MMFEKQKKAIRKEITQELRIEQLEDIICPNGSHTWTTPMPAIITWDMDSDRMLTDIQICEKCKKKREAVPAQVREVNRKTKTAK